MHRPGAKAEGFKALRRAVLGTLVSLVVIGMSVTTAFQLKLSLTVVVGGSPKLSVATKLDLQESTEVNVRQNLQQSSLANMSLQEARESVVQLQRPGAKAEGFKALRRAVLGTLVSLVVIGMSVTTAFQLKQNHTIHHPN